MNHHRWPLSIALLLSAATGAAAGEPPAPLLAILDAHKEEWRPCHEAASKLMANAVAASTASREQRNADVDRLTAESDQIKKDIAKRDCSQLKEGMVKEMRAAGASDADMQAAWGAFVKSLAPAEEKK